MRSPERRALLLSAVAAGTATVLWPVSAGARGAAADVKQVIDEFFEAARRRDWDAAGRALAPEFHLWVGVDAALDRAAYVDLLKEDDLQVLDVRLEDLEIGASDDGSLAWARYHATVDAVSKGQRSVSRTAETLVFEHHRDRGWLMRHIQVSLSSAA